MSSSGVQITGQGNPCSVQNQPGDCFEGCQLLHFLLRIRARSYPDDSLVVVRFDDLAGKGNSKRGRGGGKSLPQFCNQTIGATHGQFLNEPIGQLDISDYASFVTDDAAIGATKRHLLSSHFPEFSVPRRQEYGLA